MKHLTGDDLVAKIQARYKAMKNDSSHWRKNEARESYAFKAGYQWSKEDEQNLEEQERPAVVFNRAEPVIESVIGTEIANKKEVRYFPRNLGDAQVNEMLTGASEWVRDQCDADDEEIEAFSDMLICGIGCTETRIDYDEDSDGKIWIERRDPMKMYWDGAAKKQNLVDRRDNLYVDDMTVEDVKYLWPDAQIGPPTVEPGDDREMEPHDATNAWQYLEDNAGYVKETKSYRILHYEWWERIDIYRVADPQSGKLLELTKEKFDLVKDQIEASGTRYVRQKKRKYFRAFVAGTTLLEEGPSPVNDFTFKFITGKRDNRKGMFYGLMRTMRDPSKWGNKVFVQILDVINANALGGLIAEEDAFVNWSDAEKGWANPRAVIKAQSGALVGGKIQERGKGVYPSALFELLQFAVNAIPNVSGVPLELTGLTNRNQPGVLEDQRKRAGLTILQPLFNALRRYRKEHGRMLLKFITRYISDERLIRVLGEDGNPQYVPLIRQPDTVTYDVIVDEAPDSPNQKEKVWQSMVQILPTMMKVGLPIPKELIDYMPLPGKVVAAWKKEIEQKSQPSPMAQLEIALKQMDMEEKQSKTILNKAKAMKAVADAEGVEAGNQVDIYKAILQSLTQKDNSDKKEDK